MSEGERTSLPEAVTIVLRTLRKTDREKPLTVNDIVKKTKLNARTVKKTVDVLEQTHEAFSKEDLVVMKLSSGATLLAMEPRQIGMLSLPEDVQKMIIRTKYFPQPSREQEILVHLLLREAIDKSSAINLNESDPIVSSLVEAENIEKTKDDHKFYLTEIGKMVANGTLEIYPELRTI